MADEAARLQVRTLFKSRWWPVESRSATTSVGRKGWIDRSLFIANNAAISYALFSRLKFGYTTNGSSLSCLERRNGCS